MDADELGLDPPRKRLDQCLGKSRIGGAGLPRRKRARDHPDADEEGLLTADNAGAIQRRRVIGGLGQRRTDQLLQLGLRRHHTEEPGIEHGVEQPRSPADDAREPRRGSHDVGDQPEQAWVGGKQREELQPGRHLGDDLIEGRQREVGVRGAAERIEQGGKKRDQPLARLRAPGGDIAAGLPGADSGDCRLRTAEAKPLDRGQRGRVGFIGRHDNPRRRCGRLRQLFEQGSVMRFDALELRKQRVRRRSRYRQSPRTSRCARARRVRRG